MTEQINVPKLRFGEFDKEWALNKAKINIVAGNAYKLDEYTDNGYLLIQGLHIQPDRIVLEDKPKYVKQSDGKHVKIDKGDIVLGLNRPITNNQLKASRFKLDVESVLYQRAGKLSFDISKLDSEFLYQYLKCSTFMKQLDLELIGSDQPYIRSNLFQATKNVFPLLDEQQKIASFLSKVDEKIGLLSEKKDKLTEYKRGVMQQLFNGKWHEQDGRLNFVPPTLRFKADDGSEFPDWEEKKLAEVAQFSKGKGISKADITDNGQVSCVRYGELYTTYSEVIDTVYSKTSLPEDELILSRANDVIIPSSGETALDIATASCVLHSDIALSGDLTIIRSQIDGVFLSFQLNTVRKHELASIAQGSSVIHLYSSHLKNVTVSIPDIQEQKKITKFLSAIDQKIDLVNSELNKTKEWKKGLLQQMFV